MPTEHSDTMNACSIGWSGNFLIALITLAYAGRVFPFREVLTPYRLAKINGIVSNRSSYQCRI